MASATYSLDPGTVNDPRDRWYTDLTQVLANRLPLHSEIRGKKTSIGQELLNAGVGVHTRDLQRQLGQAIRDRFLVTADLNEPDTLKRVQLNPATNITRPEVETNYVRNGSFELWASPVRLPDFWRASGTGEIDTAAGVFQGRALSILPTTGEFYLAQTRELVFRAGATITGSVWYRNPGGSTGSVPTEGFGLRIRVTENDGTEVTSFAAFDTDASAQWKNVSTSLTLSNDIVKVRVELVSTIGGGFTPTAVELDAVQLVEGASLQPWMPSILDRLFWYSFPRTLRDDADIIPPIAIEHGRRVQVVERARDFWRLPPTRVSLIGTRSQTAPTTRVGFELQVNSVEDTFLAEWVPNGTKVRKQGAPEQAQDVYGDFDLVFPIYNDDTTRGFVAGTVVDVEALAMFNDFLWVVATVERYDGTNVRMLCVVDHKYPRPTPDYLEVLCAYELTDVPAVTTAEFRNDDPLWLFLNDGTTEYGIRLYYDYALFQEAGGIVFLREDHSNLVVTRLSPRRRVPEILLNRSL